MRRSPLASLQFLKAAALATPLLFATLADAPLVFTSYAEVPLAVATLAEAPLMVSGASLATVSITVVHCFCLVVPQVAVADAYIFDSEEGGTTYARNVLGFYWVRMEFVTQKSN